MRKIIVLAFICLWGIECQCQVIKISELNGNTDTISLSKAGIVDINSSLILKINRENLILKVGDKTNSNPELINELKFYDSLLSYQNDLQRRLSENLKETPLEERFKKLGEYSNQVIELNKKIEDNPEIEALFTVYYNSYFEMPPADRKKYQSPTLYSLVKLSEEKVIKLKVIKESLDSKKITIQLTAFLNTKEEKYKKVHVENFDDYSLGEFYHAQRLVTSFSEKDMEAMNKTRDIANLLNENIDRNFMEITDSLRSNIKSIDCLKSLLENIDTLKNQKNDILEANKKILDNAWNDINLEVSGLLNIFVKLSDLDKSADSSLVMFNVIQEEFLKQTKLFPSKIDSIVKGIPGKVIEVNPQIKGLINQIGSCKTIISEDLKKLDKLKSITAGLLLPSKKAAEAGMEIGKEVKNFSIQEVPEFGFIDLKTTGKRANSDELVIRLSVRTPDEIEKQKQGTTIEKHSLTLQQIKVYSESNISLIFASPYNLTDKVKLENKFQFAPSGSLLFKVGSRNSKAWNYLEPGLGFNMSTPDFDLDGVPEVGVGGVITILRDVLSIGLSYNTKTDNPYWFFGLTLPFSMMGLPVNTVQTNAN